MIAYFSPKKYRLKDSGATSLKYCKKKKKNFKAKMF